VGHVLVSKHTVFHFEPAGPSKPNPRSRGSLGVGGDRKGRPRRRGIVLSRQRGRELHDKEHLARAYGEAHGAALRLGPRGRG